MTRDEAMRRIDRAAQENWTKLNLSGLDLEEVPSEIGKCTQLETFVLMEFQFTAFPEKRKERGKRLTKFPDAVLQLTNLKILNLYGNEITEIPEAIGQLSHLTLLELGLNQITSIPENIRQLSNLTLLYLGHNQITKIPKTIEQLSNLTVLYLHDNQITSIPETIGQLSNLTWLDRASQSNNQSPRCNRANVGSDTPLPR